MSLSAVARIWGARAQQPQNWSDDPLWSSNHTVYIERLRRQRDELLLRLKENIHVGRADDTAAAGIDTWEDRGSDFVYIMAGNAYRCRVMDDKTRWRFRMHHDKTWVAQLQVSAIDAVAYFVHRVKLDQEHLYEFGMSFRRPS